MPLACITVTSTQSRLVEPLAILERHGAREFEEILNKCVEVTGKRRIGLHSRDTRRSEVSLATAATAGITRGAAGLVVYYPVTNGGFHYAPISLREMVSEFRQIVVGRIDLSLVVSTAFAIGACLLAPALGCTLVGTSPLHFSRNVWLQPNWLSPDTLATGLPEVGRCIAESHGRE